jgi:hypothetical protein
VAAGVLVEKLVGWLAIRWTRSTVVPTIWVTVICGPLAEVLACWTWTCESGAS